MNVPEPKPRALHSLALAAILVVGFFLRFHRLEDIEFNIDQIYPIWQAINTLDNGEFPLAGQGTSVLFANPTLTGYIFLPFLLLSRVVLMAYLVTLTLNSFAIWLVYRALKKLIGIKPALVATALFAVNPWIIEDSRRTWVQSLLPFFVCLIFWALTPVLTGQTRHPQRRLLIALSATAIFANTYLLAYFIAAPVGLLLLICRQRIPRRALLIGLTIFILLMSLYLIGLTRDWDNTRARAEAFLEGDSHLSGEALSHAVRLVTGWEYAAARGINAPPHDAARRAEFSNFVHWLWTALLAIGLARALYDSLHNPARHPVALILLIWFTLPVLAMSYTRRQVHPFYLMFTVPAGHALAAWGLFVPLPNYLTEWRGNLHRTTVLPRMRKRAGGEVAVRLYLVLLVLTAGVNGLNSMRFAQETAANPTEHLPYTLALRDAIGLGHDIQNAYTPGLTVYTPMDEWTPMVFAGRTFPVVVNNEMQNLVTIPRSGGLYMTFVAPDQPLNPIMHGTLAIVPPFQFSDGTRAPIWKVGQNFRPRNAADIASDIGVRFIGWDLLEPLSAGRRAHLRSYWQVDSLSPDRYSWNFVPYAHVFAGNGERILIVDGVRLPVETWQVGDWIIEELIIEIPGESRGPFAINIGIFDGVAGRNAIFHYAKEGEMIFTANLVIIEAEP